MALVFRCWEKWLVDAGICSSLRDIDFIEMHAFGAQPKTPNILADPAGYAAEQDRLRKAYAEAYSSFFADNLPENGVPCRFTIPSDRFPGQGGLIRVLLNRSPPTRIAEGLVMPDDRQHA